MVIATRILGVKGKATGSETAEPLAVMVTDESPLNVNFVMVDAVTALFVPSGETAMFTDFIVTGDVQVPFENFTRNVSPPIETRITCLTVLFAIAGGIFVLFVPMEYGAQAQVPTHPFPAFD
jgi:hypothetical protein